MWRVLACSAIAALTAPVLASESDIGTLIRELEKACAPGQRVTRARSERMMDLKGRIRDWVAAGEKEAIAAVEREIRRADAGDASRIGMTCLLLTAMTDWDGFSALVGDLVASPQTPQSLKPHLLGLAGMVYRTKFTQEELRDLFSAAAESEDEWLRMRAIRHLVGFTPRLGGEPRPEGPPLIKPIDRELGIRLLRNNALRADLNYWWKKRYLDELLAQDAGAETQAAYAKVARECFGDRIGSSAQLRLSYAKQLLAMGKIEKSIVDRLQAEHEESEKMMKRSREGARVRTGVKNGEPVRNEDADPTTMPGKRAPVTQPTKSCPTSRKK